MARFLKKLATIEEVQRVGRDLDSLNKAREAEVRQVLDGLIERQKAGEDVPPDEFQNAINQIWEKYRPMIENIVWGQG